MSKAVNSLDAKDKVIRILVIIVAVLGFVVIHAHYTVMKTPKDWNFYQPPDLSLGGAMGLNTVPDVVAYNFAYTMWAGVNTWDKDGSKDFLRNLDMYRNYFGTKFLGALRRSATAEENANKFRLRTVKFVLGGYSVQRFGDNKFKVEMLVDVVDTIKGQTIKDERIKYSFVVVPNNVPRSVNPWQLKIEGEFAPSVRVKKEER